MTACCSRSVTVSRCRSVVRTRRRRISSFRTSRRSTTTISSTTGITVVSPSSRMGGIASIGRPIATCSISTFSCMTGSSISWSWLLVRMCIRTSCLTSRRSIERSSTCNGIVISGESEDEIGVILLGRPLKLGMIKADFYSARALQLPIKRHLAQPFPSQPPDFHGLTKRIGGGIWFHHVQSRNHISCLCDCSATDTHGHSDPRTWLKNDPG